MYSGKSGCSPVECFFLGSVVAFGQSGCTQANWFYLIKSGCIRSKWLYLGKVVVFGQNDCNRAKVVLFG